MFYVYITEIEGEVEKSVFTSTSRCISTARDDFLRTRGWKFVAELQVLSIDYDRAVINIGDEQFRRLLTRTVFVKSESGNHEPLMADKITTVP